MDDIVWVSGVHPQNGRLIDAPYVDHLPREEHNLARRLTEAGDQTGHAGQWHLGHQDWYPDRQGFDVNLGGTELGLPKGGHFSPWQIPGLEDADVPEGTHIDDDLTDQMCERIRNRDSDKRFERCHFQSDAAYASMVQTMDANVGKLRDTPEAEGIAEQTIVVFYSDNGGLSTIGGHLPDMQRPTQGRQGLDVRREHARAVDRARARRDRAGHGLHGAGDEPGLPPDAARARGPRSRARATR
jgi:arylsulfatase A-like enzyme